MWTVRARALSLTLPRKPILFCLLCISTNNALGLCCHAAEIKSQGWIAAKLLNARVRLNYCLFCQEKHLGGRVLSQAECNSSKKMGRSMQLLCCVIWIRCGQAYGTLLLNQSCELHAVGLQWHCNPLTQLERHRYATPHSGPASFQSAASSWLRRNSERPTSGSPCFREVLFAFQCLFRKEPGRSTNSDQGERWSSQTSTSLADGFGQQVFARGWAFNWERQTDLTWWPTWLQATPR